MRFNHEVTQIIRESGAYQNSFFDACRQVRFPFEAQRLCPYARNWYLITRSFALHATCYLGVLAKELKREPEPGRTEKLQEALQQAAWIVVNDLGLGLKQYGNPSGREGIHYVMFGCMARKLGLDNLDVQRNNLAHWPRVTTELLSAFRYKFQHPIEGAACLRVVEEIAYNIVDSMLPLFYAALGKPGRRLFTRRSLLYLTLHRKIEKHHAAESQGVLQLVATTSDQQSQALQSVTEIATLFARFWEKMEAKVFVKSR